MHLARTTGVKLYARVTNTRYMSETDGESAADADPQQYEVAVIGGGPAGLSAALYTTRLSHETVVIDRGGGRAAMMLDTHNVIGVTEDVSGNEFLQTATEQVKNYGGDVVRDYIDEIEQDDDGRFHLSGNSSPTGSSLGWVSPMRTPNHRCRGPGWGSITVCTVTPTCSSTNRCT